MVDNAERENGAKSSSVLGHLPAPAPKTSQLPNCRALSFRSRSRSQGPGCGRNVQRWQVILVEFQDGDPPGSESASTRQLKSGRFYWQLCLLTQMELAVSKIPVLFTHASAKLTLPHPVPVQLMSWSQAWISPQNPCILPCGFGLLLHQSRLRLVLILPKYSCNHWLPASH